MLVLTEKAVTILRKIEFLSLPPPLWISYSLDFQVTSLTYECVKSYNTSHTCITIIYATMKGACDGFNGDFAVKNFAPGFEPVTL